MLFVAGCSKNDPKQPEKEAWVDDLSLPVPIEFGSSYFNVETKAGLVDASNIDDTKFYIWAADTAKLASWAEDSEEEILLRNVPASIASYDPTSETSSKVKFLTAGNKEITYFYPYGSKYNYSFFAYGVQAANVPECKYDQTEGAYYAEFDLGFDDIVYAQSHAHIKKGFNASYIRTYYSDESKLPHLQFRHVTSALHFNFKIDDQAEGISNPEMVKIDSIVIRDVYTKARLWVAHKNKATAGALVRDENSKADLNIKLDAQVGEDGTVDLGYVFLAPQKSTDEDRGVINATMYVKVPISQVENEEMTYDNFSVDLSIKRTYYDKVNQVRNTFDAGSVYDVTITMKTPRSIEVTAGVIDWNPGYLDANSTTGTVIE